tara:strand:- start:268 stop:420 length:153 start_codon:yes stop_codon:yes gene_type:complete
LPSFQGAKIAAASRCRFSKFFSDILPVTLATLRLRDSASFRSLCAAVGKS